MSDTSDKALDALVKRLGLNILAAPTYTSREEREDCINTIEALRAERDEIQSRHDFVVDAFNEEINELVRQRDALREQLEQRESQNEILAGEYARLLHAGKQDSGSTHPLVLSALAAHKKVYGDPPKEEGS